MVVYMCMSIILYHMHAYIYTDGLTCIRSNDVIIYMCMYMRGHNSDLYSCIRKKMK